MESQHPFVNHHAQYDHHSLSQIDTGDLYQMGAGMETNCILEDIMQCDTIRQENAPPIYQVVAPNVQVPINTDHFSRLPDLNELEGMHDFEVTLDGNQSGKSTWIYSSSLGKVFVKMNAKITFDVSFKPMNMLPPQPMFLRVIPVYSDPAELGNPVKRCANHKSNERPFMQDGHEIDISSHLLRSNMLNVMYVGQTDGRTYGERFAVRVPLDSEQQKIILEFGCQNSCSGINRRTTALLFCLEDEGFNLLGKRITNFKVCSCPKRDKDKEETESGSKKRKPGEESKFCPPGKKPAKLQVKEEPTTPLSSEPENQICDLLASPSIGEHSITITMFDEESLNELLLHAFRVTTASMVTRSGEVERIKPILKALRKQMEERGCKPK